MSFTKKYFALIVLASLLLGLLWPAPGMIIKPYNAIILMVMMFFSCLKIDLHELKNVKKDWWRYLFIVLLVFIWPVFISYLAQLFFHFDKEIFVGLIIVSAVPSAVSVVFMSDLLGGEPTKALVSTTVAHLSSLFITPFLVWLTTRTIIDIGFLSMFLLILKLVIIPFSLAQIVRFLKKEKFLAAQTHSLNTWLLVFLNWGIVAPASGLFLGNVKVVVWLSLVIVLILLTIIPLSIWFGRNRQEKITWSVVNTYKNSGLASVIVLSILPAVGLLGVIAYAIVTSFTIVVLQWWSLRKN